MRLNFGSEMGTECRFKSDSRGPIGIAELCKVEAEGGGRGGLRTQLLFSSPASRAAL